MLAVPNEGTVRRLPHRRGGPDCRGDGIVFRRAPDERNPDRSASRAGHDRLLRRHSIRHWRWSDHGGPQYHPPGTDRRLWRGRHRMKELLGGCLLAAGILVAGATGLCMYVFFAGADPWRGVAEAANYLGVPF